MPKENLLVWNVKDGWEPLCNFLGKPVPEGPLPYDNKTGTNFMEEYAWQSSVLKVLLGFNYRGSPESDLFSRKLRPRGIISASLEGRSYSGDTLNHSKL